VDAPFKYRGRIVSAGDVAFLRSLIVQRPGISRRKLSIEVCAAWGWVQPNGMPKDAVCRGLLLSLARAGLIELPPPRWVPLRPRRRSVLALEVAVDRTPMAATLAALGPVEIRQVRRTAEEAPFNALMAMHHPLGYVQPVGEHLKFAAYAQGRPVACLAFSSAPRHLGPRDRFIGWSAEARRQNVRFVAYNTRFLILPWVLVPHLASHLLGRLAKMLPAEWARVYGHPVYFLETFVDPQRHRGTCYRAANWLSLGWTTGRGKDDRLHRGPNRTVKEVLGHPLVKDFRERLSRLA
jgi:hypothetical protein